MPFPHGDQQRPRVSWHRERVQGSLWKTIKGEKYYQPQKSEKIKQKQALKNKLCYRSTSSSSSTKTCSLFPKRHKSRREKHKHCKRSTSSSYSLSSYLSKSSETRSREGSLGSRFEVMSEEDKFRNNLPRTWPNMPIQILKLM